MCTGGNRLRVLVFGFLVVGGVPQQVCAMESTTAVGMAIACASLGVAGARVLYERHAARAVAHKYDEGALIRVVRRDDVAALRLLLKTANIDVNARDCHGNTALMKAVWYGNCELVSTLAACQKVDATIKDEYGDDALMTAATIGRADLVHALLLCRTCDINAQDARGMTALMRAAMCGHAEVIHMLLLWPGIDVTIKNYDRQTIFTLVRQPWIDPDVRAFIRRYAEEPPVYGEQNC